jgi:hypothetical protein
MSACIVGSATNRAHIRLNDSSITGSSISTIHLFETNIAALNLPWSANPFSCNIQSENRTCFSKPHKLPPWIQITGSLLITIFISVLFTTSQGSMRIIHPGFVTEGQYVVSLVVPSFAHNPIAFKQVSYLDIIVLRVARDACSAERAAGLEVAPASSSTKASRCWICAFPSRGRL